MLVMGIPIHYICAYWPDKRFSHFGNSETIAWDNASNWGVVVLYTLSNISSGSYDILKTLKQLQSRIPNYGDDYKMYLPQSVYKTFFLTLVHSDELTKEIKSLNPKKLSGPDNNSAKIIILCPNTFADNLKKVFNRPIDTVDHEILLYKPDRYSIRDHTNDFFRTYLRYFNIRLSMVLNRRWMLSHVEYLRVLFQDCSFCPVYQWYLWSCRDVLCASLCWRYCSLYVA